MYDAHGHLDRWAATMRPSKARDRLEGFRYNTVTSYCFQRQWNEARKQVWWPSKSLESLKQAFSLHPTEAAKGLSPDGWADLKTLVKRRECVAVGEINWPRLHESQRSQGANTAEGHVGKIVPLY